MSPEILTTKLYIPPPPSTLIPRPHLIKKLRQGFDKKLTIISAPAGFGKTTLLSECVTHCDFRVAWLSLDDRDDNLTRFLSYLIATLQIVYQDITVGLSGFEGQEDFQAIENVMTDILNQISQSAIESILVLDDYHVIDSLAIDQAVAFFVANLPPHMHLVIATRTDPTFPLSRLRSRGQLTEIRIEDLRFSSAEVTLFLEEGMGLKIPEEDIANLESRTEGWIAGLQLAALSISKLKSPEEISNFIARFSSSNRYILDYLTDEVLQQRPEGTRDFLFKTSILSRFNASICNAVTELDNSQEILEALEEANLFLVPLDNERVWYRYHHLFGDLLQTKMHHASPQTILHLHRRASAWYEENDMLAEAISHSLAAEDYERAAKLTEQTFFDRMSRGEDFATMMGRLVELPDKIVNARPRLNIMFTWMLMILLQLEDVEPRLAEAEARFHGRLSPDLQLQLRCIRAELLRHRGDYQKSIQQSHRILEMLPEDMTLADQQTYTGIVTNLAWAYTLVGNVESANKWQRKSLAIGQHSITLSLIALNGLALIQELNGQLQQAIDTTLRGLELVKETSIQIGHDVPAAVYAHLRLGSLLCERYRLEEADYHLALGLKIGQKWGTVGDTMRDGYVDLAKLKVAQLDFSGALAVLAMADELRSHYHSVPDFGKPIDIQKARVRLTSIIAGDSANDLERVSRWVHSQGCSEERIPKSIQEESAYLVWVRYLILQNKPEVALRVLERMISSAYDSQRHGRVIEMKVLQSLAWQALGNSDGAFSSLESALEMAEPEGYIRVFLDQGPPMEKLLREASNQTTFQKYISELLAGFKTRDTLSGISSLPSPPATSLVEPLSEREKEVLQLLSNGATNQEIAAELVIAVTTAKKHVSNILGKLGVSNRTQAVSKARELNLI